MHTATLPTRLWLQEEAINSFFSLHQGGLFMLTLEAMWCFQVSACLEGPCAQNQLAGPVALVSTKIFY